MPPLGTLRATMGLQKFEQRLERLVEGVFAKAFRSGLQPVELGRRLVREMDLHRTLGVRGTLVPNRFTFTLSPDRPGAASRRSSTPSCRRAGGHRPPHARQEGYRFPGTVAVELRTDDHLGPGAFRIDGPAGRGWPVGRPGPLRRVPRSTSATSRSRSGRAADCDLVLADPTVSKHHIELRHRGAATIAARRPRLDQRHPGQRLGVRDRRPRRRRRDPVGATVLRFETVDGARVAAAHPQRLRSSSSSLLFFLRVLRAAWVQVNAHPLPRRHAAAPPADPCHRPRDQGCVCACSSRPINAGGCTTSTARSPWGGRPAAACRFPTRR